MMAGCHSARHNVLRSKARSCLALHIPVDIITAAEGRGARLCIILWY